ncbi:phage portal protein [Aliihoeflea aestuarii]|uniref:phage portal protein n=1 Tax=Aliihoeflea aestuarii TaxID=453840 RepID=UPI002093C7C7|nr:phage portal protein [Aliihoeflea aestuarii]
MFELFGGGVVAEYAVTGRQAFEVPAVASAVALLSGSVASLDILVERRDGDNWVQDKDHHVAELLADQPNDWSSTYQLIRDLVATALTSNEGAVALVNKIDGKPIEVIHYAPGSYTIDYSTDGRLEPSYRIGNRPVGNSDIIHLRSPFERCPLSLAAGAIGVAHKLERHAGNLFARGARPSGIISTPKAMGDEGVKKMLKGWRAAHEGPENSGRTAILFDSATWMQTVLTSVDAQFLETWKHAILEICRAFRIPPQLLYDHERVTWANGEQAAKEWLAGLEFWMRPLEAAMRRALFSEDERYDWRIRFDRDDFTNVDLTARATAVSSLISSEVINRNEARDWLGMGPRTGGDEFGNPHINPTKPVPADGGRQLPQNEDVERKPTNDA